MRMPGLLLVATALFALTERASAQILPPPPVRDVGSWVSLSPFMAHEMPDPRGLLTYSFYHQVTYETRASGLTLGLEVFETADDFDDLQLRIEFVNFVTIVPVGGAGSAGQFTGPKTYSTSSGPYPILTGITNMQATANIRVTVTLSSKFALAGNRQFLFRYSLY